MPKAKALNGKDFMVFVAGKATALATSHKLSLNADTSDAASKDDGMWDESTVTKMSWEASTEALVSSEKKDTNFEALYDAFIAGVPVEIVAGVPTNITDDGVPEGGWTAPSTTAQTYYKGKAIITSLERTDAKGDSAKLSAQFKGVGKLEKTAGA